jgi:hypothetical protein
MTKPARIVRILQRRIAEPSLFLFFWRAAATRRHSTRLTLAEWISKVRLGGQRTCARGSASGRHARIYENFPAHRRLSTA